MPGVVISTAVRTGPSNTTVRNSSQFFAAGITERGPVGTATLVQSLEEFETYYGGFVSYGLLHPSIQTFFEEGGTRAYVSRIVGDASTPGVKTLKDGTAVDTIKIEAIGAGDWSDNVEVQVISTDDLVSGSVALKVWYNSKLVLNSGPQLTVAGLVNAVNTDADTSVLVTATSLASASVNPLPAVLARTALAGGDQDLSGTLMYAEALQAFDDAKGDGSVAVTDSSSFSVQSLLVAHAALNNRIAILHSDSTQDMDPETGVVSDAAAITALDNPEHAAYFFPWVYIPTDVAGVNRLIPPDGYFAAKRALAHNQTGPHQPAAGILSKARFVNGVATPVDAASGDALDAASVNAIRIISNSVRIYGARSSSDDTRNYRYYTAKDVVNSVVVQAHTQLDDLLFSVINGRTTVFADVESRLISLLERMRVIGAFYEAYDQNGTKVDVGYTVKCNTQNNPVASLATGLIKAEVGLRVSSVGDKINVTIIKSNLTTSVV
jgi:hypothetical protein